MMYAAIHTSAIPRMDPITAPRTTPVLFSTSFSLPETLLFVVATYVVLWVYCTVGCVDSLVAVDLLVGVDSVRFVIFTVFPVFPVEWVSVLVVYVEALTVDSVLETVGGVIVKLVGVLETLDDVLETVDGVVETFDSGLKTADVVLEMSEIVSFSFTLVVLVMMEMLVDIVFAGGTTVVAVLETFGEAVMFGVLLVE